MNILLIAGHGAGDPGATAVHNGKVYREADETRSLVRLLASELSANYLVDVGTFSFDRNAYADLQAKKLPNAVFQNYDYVLEIHFNACTSDKADGHTKGVECYVTQEERSVGVELQIVQRIAALGMTNRGVKRKNYAVIKAAKAAGVSSALLEVCFIDDPDDWQCYQAKKRDTAHGIAAGIAAGFGLSVRPMTSREIVQQAAGLSDVTMDYLANYKYGKDLLDKLAEAMKRGV